MQWGYTQGIRDYMLAKKDYLMTQVGNPDGPVRNQLLRCRTNANTTIQNKPNKKYYDPRNWVREGEKTMKVKVEEALKKFNTANKL